MQGQQGSDLCQSLREWCDRIPAVSQVVMYTLLVCYMLTYLPDIAVLLVNYPEKSLLGLELWRLLTASFVPMQLFSLIITLFMYLPTACDTERRMSSIKYLIYLLVNCVVIQTVSAGLLLAGATALGFYPVLRGLWGVIMLEIVVRSNRDPEAVVSLWCCPATLKSKYYPFVLLLLFLLLGGILLDLLVGTALGYVYVADHAGRLQLSDSKATKLQECAPFRWLKGVRNFVTVENSGLPFTVVQRVQQGSSTTSSNPAPAQPQFVPFSGRGYTLAEAPRQQRGGYMAQEDEEEF